jgi:cell division protein FtsQ
MAQARKKQQPVRDERWAARLRFAGFAAMLMLLVGGLWGLVAHLRDPHTLPIRAVRIEGEILHLNRDRLREVATPVVSGGFFTVDLAAVGRALSELPWVYRVSVRRQWPDTLVVAVEEQRAVARWGDAALLNPFGQVFAPPSAEFPPDLPELTGPAGREESLLRAFAEAEEMLLPLGLELEAMHEDERRSRELRLAGEVRIALGREEQASRLRRLAAVFERALAGRQSEIAGIDLRYTNGLAVAWREPQPERP